ncbi:OmpH family outer membrane protein [Sphingomonas panacisoli]|uniref:OmpH family outer membrane protein n=1 Tax=Sphingomonas panacisoli TaxID=1813879 RepID=A0A5B8LGT3_9SPHN|nr:OmpH family outer membrane protein [Sphingomonas panacisoli]QDZ07518.1 OmpH family outer membrane protein [Sphingomonas panacisoli]
MKTNLKYLGLGAIALTAALAGSPAQAQSVATADFDGAVVKTKAFTAAAATIKTTYQTQITQVEGYQKELQALLAPFDTNKDSQIDDNELRAAQASPTWATVVAKQQQLNTAQAPVARAQAYVFEQVSSKLNAAVQAVITARNLTLIVKPDAVVWANQTGNITAAITAELDKLVPTANAIPPATWQPGGQPGAAPAAGAAPAPATSTPAPAAGGKKPGR